MPWNEIGPAHDICIKSADGVLEVLLGLLPKSIIYRKPCSTKILEAFKTVK